jgi:acetyltransferase-like isoleucine patch superfamily enzyme
MPNKQELRDLFSSPFTEYLFFLFNWYFNRIKQKNKNLYQCYMSILKSSEIGQGVKIYPYAKVNQSKIGSYTYIGVSTIVFKATIGKFCSIGQNCNIGIGSHPIHFVSTSPVFYSTRNQLHTTFVDEDSYSQEEEFLPVIIGNDVWIGNNVTIKGNIHIGDGAVIGNGAIVTKNIPSYAVYAGVPAKLIRFRFSDEIIDFLLKIKWWEKDELWLKENHKTFRDIYTFYNDFSQAS